MIRNATPRDALAVAPLMFQAMEEIVYKMIGKPHKEEAIAMLAQLFAQKGNQYSYENAWVYEEAGSVVGSVIAYDGAQLHTLRAPVLALIRNSYGIDIVLEDETTAGELYIDTLSVLPTAQGQGIGRKLFQHLKKINMLIIFIICLTCKIVKDLLQDNISISLGCIFGFIIFLFIVRL